MDFNNYFNNIDLNKTEEKKGIHFEQKITPDLLWCISQVILDLTKNNLELHFTDADVRTSENFNILMRDYFSKAEQSERTENEYNKVSSYQLGLLVYTDILGETTDRPKLYYIKNIDILKELASHELTALKFLVAYVEKFIADNGLTEVFNDYKNNPTQSTYIRAKEAYWQWAKTHTRVRTEDPRHSNRVFNKIFNLFAYGHAINGESGAKVIDGKCPYSFLVYKRINFRDSSMPRGLSRREFYELMDQEASIEQRERQAKKEVRNKHLNGELTDPALGYINNNKFMGHHILPQNEYKDFRDKRENIIMLTPDQHYAYAHETGTQTINTTYQVHCLIGKLHSIKKSLQTGENFYSMKNFAEMVNTLYGTGFNQDSGIEDVQSFLKSKI